jgi:hypothetical protein
VIGASTTSSPTIDPATQSVEALASGSSEAAEQVASTSLLNQTETATSRDVSATAGDSISEGIVAEVATEVAAAGNSISEGVATETVTEVVSTTASTSAETSDDDGIELAAVSEVDRGNVVSVAAGSANDNIETVGPDDPALRELIERIQGRLADTCILALPAGGGETPLQLQMISADDQTISEFEAAALRDLSFEMERNRQLIDTLQCAALNMLRTNDRYPTFPISIGLVTDQIDSGGNLQGVVRGLGSRTISIILVDDNGVVQNLRRFVTQFGSEYRFDIPMTRDGTPRDTRQLLVVLATQGPIATLAQMDGQLADDVFPEMSQELADQYSAGIAVFDVR